ncbi:MAG: major capsid protein [Anaerolineae bacterium]|nr:major capsid protein [Anaerolineae bacterium]
MAQPDRSEVHIDGFLTEMSVAYRNQVSAFIADRVFPVVEVAKDSGKYPEYTRDYWLRPEMQVRAYGAAHPRAGYPISYGAYTTEQFSLEHPVPDEIAAAADNPIDLDRDGMEWLTQQMLLKRELSFAERFMVAGVWSHEDNNTGAGVGIDWDDYDNSDPIGAVRACRRTVAQAIGRPANVMAMGLIVHDALLNHPDVLERIKYSEAATTANVNAAMAAVFGVEHYLVSEAIYAANAEGQAASLSPIVDDDCLICYANPTPGLLSPSAGYTFVWPAGGGAGTIYRWRDERVESDVLRGKMQYDQKMVAADGGYLLIDIA